MPQIPGTPAHIYFWLYLFVLLRVFDIITGFVHLLRQNGLCCRNAHGCLVVTFLRPYCVKTVTLSIHVYTTLLWPMRFCVYIRQLNNFQDCEQGSGVCNNTTFGDFPYFIRMTHIQYIRLVYGFSLAFVVCVVLTYESG